MCNYVQQIFSIRKNRHGRFLAACGMFLMTRSLFLSVRLVIASLSLRRECDSWWLVSRVVMLFSRLKTVPTYVYFVQWYVLTPKSGPFEENDEFGKITEITRTPQWICVMQGFPHSAETKFVNLEFNSPNYLLITKYKNIL